MLTWLFVFCRLRTRSFGCGCRGYRRPSQTTSLTVSRRPSPLCGLEPVLPCLRVLKRPRAYVLSFRAALLEDAVLDDELKYLPALCKLDVRNLVSLRTTHAPSTDWTLSVVSLVDPAGCQYAHTIEFIKASLAPLVTMYKASPDSPGLRHGLLCASRRLVAD